MRIKPDEINALIRDCAARLIMPRFNLLEASEIESKSGPNDLVTIADRETELELEAALTAAYPGLVVIGEEGIAAGRMTTAVLRDASGMVWVIDPVDGTWNFVHGKPEFAVMIACAIDGETRHGWIYDVPADRMLYAEKGGGTTINGVRQSVAPAKKLADCAGFCGVRYFAPEHRERIKAFAATVRTVRVLGCAGHEYLNVASGHDDFALYSRGQPWDHLAGTLAVAEAGGIVRRFDGGGYRPSDDRPALIVASNEDLLREIRNTLVSKL